MRARKFFCKKSAQAPASFADEERVACCGCRSGLEKPVVEDPPGKIAPDEL
jgi:hypothetical protein